VDLPNWALIAMWTTAIAGLFFLTKEMIRRFG
jgi:hypothetical protein